jgi:hypothetical protein
MTNKSHQKTVRKKRGGVGEGTDGIEGRVKETLVVI